MSFLNKIVINRGSCQLLISQVRNYAARKGTRERKKQKKVKVEEKKAEFIPHNLRDKEKLLASRKTKKFDDSWQPLPIDNVYVQRYYQWKVYPFVEAVQCHRETHHPEMYNQPNASLHVTIELNMEGQKKTRFVDDFTRIAAIPHKFQQEDERSIIAFTKQTDTYDQIKEAGAQLVGGAELIKEIQNGSISLQDFKFAIAHPNILPELVVLRGLMRRKFPNPKSGTLDVDVTGMVNRFMHGINYSAVKDEYEKDFGQVDSIVGTLDMDPAHLQENFSALVRDLYTMKPKRPGTFIRRCLTWSPPSSEKLKVDHTQYLSELSEEQESDGENEAEEEKVAV